MERYLFSLILDSCKFIWKPEWGRVIVIRLKNSLENNDNYKNFKMKIAPIDVIISRVFNKLTPIWK